MTDDSQGSADIIITTAAATAQDNQGQVHMARHSKIAFLVADDYSVSL